MSSPHPIYRLLRQNPGDYRATRFRGFPASIPPPEDDGLPVLGIKAHSIAKLEAVGRYANAFSTALKDHPTAYLDLFAGPGVARLDDGQLVWGSPLLALQCPTPFDALVFVERDPDRIQALKTRSGKLLRPGRPVTLIAGPAADCIAEALGAIPRRSMTLTVIDPFRLEVSLATIQELSTAFAALDIVLLFADGMDLVRNVEAAFHGDPAQSQRLDRIYGPIWRSRVQLGPPAATIAAHLRDLYINQLRSIGLTEIGRSFPVLRNNVRLYTLLFASRHRRGVEIWNRTTSPPQSAQQELY